MQARDLIVGGVSFSAGVIATVFTPFVFSIAVKIFGDPKAMSTPLTAMECVTLTKAMTDAMARGAHPLAIETIKEAVNAKCT